MAIRQIKITQSITQRDSAVTEKYLSEISKQQMITKEDEVELAKRIKSGDKKALDMLVSANLRFAFSVAKKYQNRGLSLNDLVNEANIGLIKAAHRFDETRGFKFISFAVWWIRQSVLEAISNHSRIVRLPMNKVGTLGRYGGAFSELEQILGRTPTVTEVAEHLGVDDKEISAIEGYMFKHTSLDANAFGDDDLTSVSDTMADENGDKPSDRLFRQSLMVDIERVFKSLTEIERKVLKKCYGLRCRVQSLGEIADGMSCTKERVRQIRLKAIRKMREKNNHTILEKYI